MAACWATVDGARNQFCASRSMAGTQACGATSQPSRQPVMPKYLLKLLITTASSPWRRTVSAGAP